MLLLEYDLNIKEALARLLFADCDQKSFDQGIELFLSLQPESAIMPERLKALRAEIKEKHLFWHCIYMMPQFIHFRDYAIAQETPVFRLSWFWRSQPECQHRANQRIPEYAREWARDYIACYKQNRQDRQT